MLPLTLELHYSDIFLNCTKNITKLWEHSWTKFFKWISNITSNIVTLHYYNKLVTRVCGQQRVHCYRCSSKGKNSSLRNTCIIIVNSWWSAFNAQRLWEVVTCWSRGTWQKRPLWIMVGFSFLFYITLCPHSLVLITATVFILISAAIIK